MTITIYSKNNCVYCNKAKTLLKNLGLEYEEKSLEKEHDILTESFSKIQQDEQKFLDIITEKYGRGTLNPETGVFTPTENKS